VGGIPAIVIFLEIKTDLWSVICCHIRGKYGEARVDYKPLEILTSISNGVKKLHKTCDTVKQSVKVVQFYCEAIKVTFYVTKRIYTNKYKTFYKFPK
jgi:hypothetical protein